MVHWIRSKNLPYSIEEVKAMTASCKICAEIKPQFFRTNGQLIKAIAPFERINIDFKGPLPTNTQNRYLLTIIDEYSRFPFAYPCSDLSAATVIKCLKDLFHTFGFPAYVHSDRGSSFMSEDLKRFLTSLGIATSRTTPYNPQGNGQVERLNCTLWKAIQLNLRSRNMKIYEWEQVYLNALHSIRSLLCTSINATPHERLFRHPRRSPNGKSLPSWLINPGPVLVKRNVRNSKYEPLVEEAEVLEANPSYSHVRLSDGRECMVSNRQLAPLPRLNEDDNDSDHQDTQADDNSHNQSLPDENLNLPENRVENESRHSSRSRHPPSYLRDYVSVSWPEECSIPASFV